MIEKMKIVVMVAVMSFMPAKCVAEDQIRRSKVVEWIRR